MIGPMNVKLFGETFACECGRTHRIEPRRVFYSASAAMELAATCLEITPGRRVAVLFDARTRQAAGEDVMRAFASADWRVQEVLIPDPAPHASPVCDNHTRDALQRRLDAPDLICPVGAGVVSDLGKWLARDMGVPFATFATAASMNGYASANIAPTIGLLKSLLDGRAPAMVASSPRVLAAAPREMTASGLGDVLAKSVSSADWYCNHRLFGDYFCPRAAGLIEQIEPLYLARPADLPAGKPEAIEPLFWALLLTGVAMTMAGTSAPASGGEHLISHWLDMTAMRDGASHDLHGRQVGVGTILTSELYRRVLACDSPKLAPPAQTIDTADWGHASPAIQAEYARKLPRLLEAREKLAAGNAWDDLRQSLQPMVRKPEIIRDCLAAAKAAHKAEHIGCDRPRLLAALLRAHEIRSRFTILDLAYLAGVLPGQAQEIVEGWA